MTRPWLVQLQNTHYLQDQSVNRSDCIAENWVSEGTWWTSDNPRGFQSLYYFPAIPTNAFLRQHYYFNQQHYYKISFPNVNKAKESQKNLTPQKYQPTFEVRIGLVAFVEVNPARSTFLSPGDVLRELSHDWETLDPDLSLGDCPRVHIVVIAAETVRQVITF